MGISTLKFLKFFTAGIIALEIICSRVNFQEMNVSYRKSASMLAWPARRCWVVLCSKTAVVLWEQFTSENSVVKWPRRWVFLWTGFEGLVLMGFFFCYYF